MATAPIAQHLLRAKDLADARYRDPLSVTDLAAAAGLSPAHFSRRFKAAFGESPHQYLLTRRLERAAALLCSTDWTVADICFAVGAESLGSFTTSFRRMFGLTPLAYRAAYPPAQRHVHIWQFRWLCVGPPGDDGTGLVLMPVPGPPMLDEESGAELAALIAKGAGGTLFLETDDCQAAYDELSARGVRFNDLPTAQPYGIDTSFRDPSGNNIRLTQVLEFDPARG